MEKYATFRVFRSTHSYLNVITYMLFNTFIFFFFFLNDTAPTEFSPLPLHDALPISRVARGAARAVLRLRALHGSARPVLRPPVQRRGLRAGGEPQSARVGRGLLPKALRRRDRLPEIGRAHV